MAGARHYDQDKDSTLYVGNMDERCTDPLIWELMLQAGPVVNVHLPKDRVTQSHQGYGFVEFASEDDADYAAKIMNQIRLYGKPIRVNKASADRKTGGPGGTTDGQGQGVGAELFVGNLDGMVDERTLYETFQRFGPLVGAPKIARDESNLSKGYGFISYASFEASDDAIANMHGQYLSNKEITVQYAYKKDGKGERHGDQAERALAAQAKKHGVQPTIPALPGHIIGLAPNAPPNPAAMNGFPPPGSAPPVRPPQAPPAYNNYGPPPQAAYNAAPAPPSFYPQYGALPAQPNGMASRSYNQSPLAAPPSGAGLPARPPPSTGGYGGPMNAPGMGPPGMQQQGGMPPGPPPGMPPGMPPGQPPGGFRPPPPGAPPQGFPHPQR